MPHKRRKLNTKLFQSSVLLFVLVMGSLCGAAKASEFSYQNRADFGAAVANPTIENFDGVPDQTTIANGTSFDGVVYSSSDPDLVVTNLFVALSPDNTLGTGANQYFLPGDSLTLTFQDPTYAFGVSFNALATGADYLITTNTGDTTTSFYDPFPGIQTGEFAGLTDTNAFTSVTISSLNSNQPFTLDDVTYVSRASAVPEGDSLLILAGGLLPLAALGYRGRLQNRLC